MKKKIVALMMVAAMGVAAFAGCGQKPAETTTTAVDEKAVEEAVSEAIDEAVAEEVVEEAVTEAVEEAVADEVVEEAVTEAVAEADVTYVDGFYANDGNGNDFVIAFYETSDGDVCYVNDGTQEGFAAYTVEDGAMDDGTAYYLVTVGETQLGYVDNGGTDVAIIDADGNVYAAGHLSEEEADTIYNTMHQ